MIKIDRHEGYRIRAFNSWITLSYPVVGGFSMCYACLYSDDKFLIWLNNEFPLREFFVIDKDEIKKLGDHKFREFALSLV
jgi:hypothetical protein